MRSIIFFLLLSFSVLSAQNPVPRDTSYTLHSATKKYLKAFPFIRPVKYDPSSGTLMEKDVPYVSYGSRQILLDVFVVSQPSEKKKPAVILIHGGGWQSGDKRLMHPLADFLARHGCVAFTVEYRLSPEAQYPAAVEDLNHAIDWIYANADRYQVDTQKIATLGGSAGAQLAGLMGLKFGTFKDSTKVIKKRIHAVVNIDGVMDFTCEEALQNEDDTTRVTCGSAWFGGHYVHKKEVWKDASPVYYAGKDSPPILFLDSSQDRFHAGRDAVIKILDQYNIYTEVHTFKDARHCFWLFDPWFEKTGEYIINFLDKVLKD